MTLFKTHAAAGLILALLGIVLDYTFIEARVSEAFKADPLPLIHSWKHRLQSMSVSYMIILGFLQVGLAVLSPHVSYRPRIAWAVMYLTLCGSIVLLATGFWYAVAGPSFQWEPRCTVLTVGLAAVLGGVCLEIYALVSQR